MSNFTKVAHLWAGEDWPADYKEPEDFKEAMFHDIDSFGDFRILESGVVEPNDLLVLRSCVSRQAMR
jgi:hypothetical protein